MARIPKKHQEFRRFLRESGEENIFRAFVAWQREQHPERSHRWWADRWGIDVSNVTLWAAPFGKGRTHRRIGPSKRFVFGDLREMAGITMDEYYRSVPPSRQARPEPAGVSGDGRAQAGSAARRGGAKARGVARVGRKGRSQKKG